MAESFGSPVSPYPPAQPPKKRNTTLIIIIVVVLLLLCCCCSLVWALWTYGDQILYELNLTWLSPVLSGISPA